MSEEHEDLESRLRSLEPRSPRLDWKAIWIEQGRALERHAATESRLVERQAKETDTIRAWWAHPAWSAVSACLAVACLAMLGVLLKSSGETTPIPSLAEPSGDGVKSSIHEALTNQNPRTASNQDTVAVLDRGPKQVDVSQLVNRGAPMGVSWHWMSWLGLSPPNELDVLRQRMPSESLFYRYQQNPRPSQFVSEPQHEPWDIPELHQTQEMPSLLKPWRDLL
ncbi:MAG: hypothetical protein KDA83_05930 [Planctomycetales bacterium]|nr:hypothetical protein [Planctomycetales bacterium]